MPGLPLEPIDQPFDWPGIDHIFGFDPAAAGSSDAVKDQIQLVRMVCVGINAEGDAHLNRTAGVDIF